MPRVYENNYKVSFESSCKLFNSLIAILNTQSNGPSYTVIGTLAIDGWAVTFGAARRRLSGATALPGHSVNGQCTNFVLFDVALLALKSRGLIKMHVQLCY